MVLDSEDCSSHRPFVSELLETEVIVVENEDGGVKGEVALDAKTLAENTGIKEDEMVREQCVLSDTMETPAEGVVQAEAVETKLFQDVDEFLGENEENERVDGGEAKELTCKGFRESPAKSPEETIERVGYEKAKAEGMDTAPDAKTTDEVVHGMVAKKKMASGMLEDESNETQSNEVGAIIVENQPPNEAKAIEFEVAKRESVKGEDIKDSTKETIQAEVPEEGALVKAPQAEEGLSAETIPTDTVESKLEKRLMEEELECNLDLEKENEQPARNAAAAHVGSKSIVSDMPLAKGEAGSENGVKEQMKDGRTAAEPQEKSIVEDAANEITEAEPVADPTDGAAKDDDPVECEIRDSGTTKASEAGNKLSELVRMDQVAEHERNEKLEAGVEVEASEKVGEFSPMENAKVSTERIVREIDEVERASREEREQEDEKRDLAKKPSAMTAVREREGNAGKEQVNGKQSRKLMSRVKSSLGKVKKAIVGRSSPVTKTIIVDARLEERSNDDCNDKEQLVNH